MITTVSPQYVRPLYLTAPSGMAQTPVAVKPVTNASIQERLAQIPAKDRQRIEHLFKHYLKNKTFGYTLLGEKPAGFTITRNRTAPTSLRYQGGSLYRYLEKVIDYIQSKYFPHLRKETPWETWEKHQHLFPISDDYILRRGPHVFLYSKKTSEYDRVIFVHKPSALKAIQQNWDVFESVLKKEFPEQKFTPKTLLQALETDNPVSKHILAHDWTIGILFGYGRNNAYLCNRIRELEGKLANDAEHVAVRPSKGFSTIKEELDWAETRLEKDMPGIREHYWNRKGRVKFPAFLMSLEYPESKLLLEKYVKAQNNVQALAEHPQAFEEVLKRLTRIGLKAIA